MLLRGRSAYTRANRNYFGAEIQIVIQIKWLLPVGRSESRDFIPLRRACHTAEDHDVNVCQRWGLPDGSQNGQTVVLREMQIKQDHARVGIACALAVLVDESQCFIAAFKDV